MKLLGFSGSLRAESSNARLLQVAAALAPTDLEFRLESSLGRLPHFNPDIPVASNSEVQDYVARVRDCDGIVISSPVYAGGYPGTLKNALDWLVGTDAFVEKPFMMLSASDRMPAVQDSLIAVLETMSGVHVEAASTFIPLLGTQLTAAEIADSPPYVARIEASIHCFREHIEARESPAV